MLPRIVDPNGHATTIAAPGGTILAYDRATGSFARMADGFRNAYDMAFAPNGDLFTFDSDMEWDIGLPWYRAVRVVHVLPGGDYGWRTGSADWPAWYPDSLPPVLDTGAARRPEPRGATRRPSPPRGAARCCSATGRRAACSRCTSLRTASATAAARTCCSRAGRCR